MSDPQNRDADGKEDAASIEGELAELEGVANLPDALDDMHPFFERRRDYRAFWQKAKEISDLFRQSTLLRGDRDRLWARHSSLCEQVKDMQEREREHRQNESGQHRRQILGILREARMYAKGAGSLGELSRAREGLQEAMQLMKEKFLLKDDRQECWEEWREINDMVPERHHDICHGNYEALHGEVHRIYGIADSGDPHEAIREIQGTQREIKEAELTREHRQSLRRGLQECWDRAAQRLDQRRRERERKHEDWRSRMEHKLEQLEKWVEDNESKIASIAEEIDELEGKINNAWNEDWAERARGWVHDKQDRIAHLERRNVGLGDQMREIRSKLRD